MNTSVQKRFKTAMLASAALLAASVVAPQPAKADATLAVALGGSALLGLILHAQQPMRSASHPQASATHSYPRYTAPVPTARTGYPSYAPVVYASVAPIAVRQTPIYRVSQPVNYHVTAPIAPPQRNIYRSSANMNYPVAPVMHNPHMQHRQPMQYQQPMQQQAQQQVQQQPAQAQQMSYQPQYGAVQPQYGTTYPQY